MSDTARIEPGHEDYQAMTNRAHSNGGKRFNFKGSEWLVVRDGDKIVYVRAGSLSGISEHYDSSSIPKHG